MQSAGLQGTSRQDVNPLQLEIYNQIQDLKRKYNESISSRNQGAGSIRYNTNEGEDPRFVLEEKDSLETKNRYINNIKSIMNEDLITVQNYKESTRGSLKQK